MIGVGALGENCDVGELANFKRANQRADAQGLGRIRGHHHPKLLVG